MNKLGSLFDGSGGFPLAGALCGIEPVWAAEVEPYPIAVTRSRFPKMKHLGDISKVSGAEIEPVDLITFGSPCQDLSVAGKRAGLKHEANGDEETTRSGLFMEAVRIIKEMRQATNGEYPRFALWENVPGAFSSNKGEDFRIVCEELIKIAEPQAFMPEVPKGGWNYADSYIGDGWSLAYRVFDSQYWGVPQRRRRIYLVADFRGECAREVLFECEGLRGYFAEGGTPWQTTPANAQRSPGADDPEGSQSSTINRGGSPQDSQGCIRDRQGGNRDRGLDAITLEPSITAREGGHIYEGVCGTIRANAGDNRMAVAYTMQDRAGKPVGVDIYNGIETGDVAATLTTQGGGTASGPSVVYAVDQGGGKSSANVTEDKAPTLCTTHGGEPAGAYKEEARTLHNNTYASTLMARDYKGMGRWDTLGSVVSVPTGSQYIVRRLTPTECARLQGFADWWGVVEKKDNLTDEEYRFWLEVRNTHAAINGKKVQEYTVKQMLTWYNKLWTDSSEYKMWGNGIALPTALYCMQGIAEALNTQEDVEEWML